MKPTLALHRALARQSFDALARQFVQHWKPELPDKPRTARQVQLSDDVDDYAYLADGELGIAPTITGITEDDQNKPLNAKGPEDINKWCVRECERAWISPPGRPDATPELPDFSVRFYNKAPHRRDP
jgi:hypothetical protein